MNRIEYLLDVLAEEGSEVAVRVSKALRFTLDEVQPGQEKTNRQRLIDECIDFAAVVGMLVEEGIIHDFMEDPDILERIGAKQEKVDRFFEYSKTLGVVTEALGVPTSGTDYWVASGLPKK